MSQHDVHVDTRGQDRELAKAYKRMASAGKGDSPRNCWSSAYRRNYDAIDWGLNAIQRIFHGNGTVDGHGRFREGMGNVKHAIYRTTHANNRT